MAHPKPKKPFATLAEDLKKIRKRPLTRDEIDRANRVFDEIGREKNPSSRHQPESPGKKIAKHPEADT